MLKRERGLSLYGASLNILAYRNITIGISRRFLRESGGFPQNRHDGSTAEGLVDAADDEGQMDPELFQRADIGGRISHIRDYGGIKFTLPCRAEFRL